MMRERLSLMILSSFALLVGPFLSLSAWAVPFVAFFSGMAAMEAVASSTLVRDTIR